MCGRRPPAAGAALHLVQVPINRPILNRQASALPLAACLGEFAVHVHEADRAGTLVQVVHILRTQEEAVTQLRLQFRQCNVSGIRHRLRSRCPPRRIELPYTCWVALPRFRSADIFNPIPGPPSARKVGNPLSALTPAPVSAKTRSFGAIEILDMFLPSQTDAGDGRRAIHPSPLSR